MEERYFYVLLVENERGEAWDNVSAIEQVAVIANTPDIFAVVQAYKAETAREVVEGHMFMRLVPEQYALLKAENKFDYEFIV